MPRYFFSLRKNGNLAVDTDGTHLTDLAAAKREAELSLRELLADAIKARQEENLPDKLIVFDDQGDEVYSLAMIDVFPKRA